MGGRSQGRLHVSWGDGDPWEGTQVWLSAAAPVLQRVDSLASAPGAACPPRTPNLLPVSPPAQHRGAWGQAEGCREARASSAGRRGPRQR